jgi:hypothetical protein
LVACVVERKRLREKKQRLRLHIALCGVELSDPQVGPGLGTMTFRRYER